jgi:hypothetical protein
VALERTDGPVPLSISREKVPTLDRSDFAPASGVERGAYVLWDSADSPDLILIGTGAQLGLALEAGRKLAVDGTAVRVVSMPCWELFEAQPDTYRDGRAARCRGAAVDRAGVALGRSKRVGDRGDWISIDTPTRRARSCSTSSVTTSTTWSRATALLARVRGSPSPSTTVASTCGPPVPESLSAHEVIDFGTDTDAVRTIASTRRFEVRRLARRLRAILVCGSGVGAAVAACKLTGIRAASSRHLQRASGRRE